MHSKRAPASNDAQWTQACRSTPHLPQRLSDPTSSALDVAAARAAEHVAEAGHVRHARIARDARIARLGRPLRAGSGRRSRRWIPRRPGSRAGGTCGRTSQIPVLGLRGLDPWRRFASRSASLLQLAPDVLVSHASDPVGEQPRLAVERFQALVLHLVHAAHLLHEQQRVRPDVRPPWRPAPAHQAERREQAVVLGDVVRGVREGAERARRRRSPASSGITAPHPAGPGIAARAAVDVGHELIVTAAHDTAVAPPGGALKSSPGAAWRLEVQDALAALALHDRVVAADLLRDVRAAAGRGRPCTSRRSSRRRPCPRRCLSSCSYLARCGASMPRGCPWRSAARRVELRLERLRVRRRAPRARPSPSRRASASARFGGLELGRQAIGGLHEQQQDLLFDARPSRPSRVAISWSSAVYSWLVLTAALWSSNRASRVSTPATSFSSARRAVWFSVPRAFAASTAAVAAAAIARRWLARPPAVRRAVGARRRRRCRVPAGR